jgi:hypothetical protein
VADEPVGRRDAKPEAGKECEALEPLSVDCSLTHGTIPVTRSIAAQDIG